MNNKGQTVLSEHVMVFFVVVAALVAMTTYVQRTFEARIHDTRDFMVSSVNSVCDANCQMAAGGNVPKEYEPYYTQQLADVFHHEIENNGRTSGSAAAIGSVYYKYGNESTQTIAASGQVPAACAGTPNGGCNLVPSGSGN